MTKYKFFIGEIVVIWTEIFSFFAYFISLLGENIDRDCSTQRCIKKKDKNGKLFFSKRHINLGLLGFRNPEINIKRIVKRVNSIRKTEITVRGSLFQAKICIGNSADKLK